MQLHFHPFDLPLKHTFSISRESRDIQESLIVGLSDGTHYGLGEATANPYYNATVPGMTDTLEQLRDLIEGTPLTSPEAYWAVMAEHLADQPFALCALDMAANDLFGQQQGMPLYAYFGLRLKDLPLSNFTIGIADLDTMVAKMKEQPWPLYKIKLGTDNDLEIIEALRQHTDAAFRVDANCGWSARQTIELAPKLKALGVEFIEQPLPAEAWEDMLAVKAQSVLPIIADESCRGEADITKCAQHFHGVNIKLTKCGGLTPARRMLAEAKSLGLKTMVGCMTESSVGISAVAQLLPMLDYVDMDGAILLREDPAEGVGLADGAAVFPDRNGTGARLK